MSKVRVNYYLGLFLLLLGIYGLTSSWQLYAQDEEQMLSVGTRLADYGTFSLNESTDSPQYSKYGPLQSILVVPFYMTGKILTKMQPKADTWLIRIPVSWFNPIIIAANAVLVVLLTELLGFKCGLWCGIAYGLGSMAWIYSKTFFAEPLTSCMLLLSLYIGLRMNRTRTIWIGYGISGLCAALALMVKVHAATIIPCTMMWIAFDAYQVSQSKKSTYVACFQLLIGFTAGLVVLGFYQWSLFGNPFSSSYGTEGQNGFTHDLWSGIYGLTLSWGRGVFWYQPLLLLLPWALIKLAKVYRIGAWIIGIMFVSQVVFYARWWAWDGAGSWGPRFLLIGMPFLFVAFGALLQEWKLYRPMKATLIFLVVWSFWVQLTGLSISINASIAYNPSADERNFSFARSALMIQNILFTNQLRHTVTKSFAQNAIVLDDGFSYSEGDRNLNELLPRWSHPYSEIIIRSDTSATIDMTMFTCRPNNAAVGSIDITVANTTLQFESICPLRTVHLFIPNGNDIIQMNSTSWNPQDLGIDRDEELGSYFFYIGGLNNDGEMKIQGRTLPAPVMPNGITKLRQWYRDYRYEHWDYWWWYLAHSALSSTQKLLVGFSWLGINVSFIVSGLYILWRTKKHVTPQAA